MIDTDPKHGGDPREVIPEHHLEDRPGVWTGEALSGPLEGERGAHLYCSGEVPGGKTEVRGVEVRGTGLYAMLPGSRHVSGVAYEWMNGRRPWNVALEPIPAELAPRAAGTGDQEPPAAGERIPHGERHEHLKDVAVRLARAGVTDYETLLAHVKVEFAERCDPNPPPEPGSLEKLAAWAAKSQIAGRERERARDNGRTHRDRDAGEAVTPDGIRFVSPGELLATVPPEPPWRLDGYLAAGALTLLGGKPKAGKSTLALAIAHHVAGGARDFLAHAINGGPVVYVSEEGAATLAHKITGDRLRIARRDTAYPRPDWRALIDAARVDAERVAAVLVVVDTFAFWNGLGPESEKDSGAMQAAMFPLLELARTGLAVLAVVHTRKGGGEDGEALRGSSALAGAADIVLELDRVTADAPRQRKLLALSRYPQTPGVLVIEHDRADGEWTVIGEGTDRGDVRDISNRSRLIAALSFDVERTRAELEELTGSPSREWHSTLEQLIEDGVVDRSGAGKKGDPYLYKKLRTNAAQNLRRNVVMGGFENAAPPIRGQHQNHDQAEPPDSAFCAETAETTEVAAATDEQEALLERIRDTYGEAGP